MSIDTSQFIPDDGSAPIARLAVTRVFVESAESHLRAIIELGDRISHRRSNSPDVSDNDARDAEAIRSVESSAAVTEALATVERARLALNDLTQWKERSVG